MGSFITLDVVIGLVFMYLLLAIICSAITEWIASLFRLRTTTLQRALQVLMDVPRDSNARDDQKRLSDELWRHPLIRSLKQGKRGPSYIPPARFAAALNDLMQRGGDEKTAAGLDRKNVQDQLSAYAPSVVPESVRVEAVEHENAVSVGPPPETKPVEEWFNDTMERATGWYRRKVMLITVAVASVVTIVSNADTIGAARILWRNPAVRAAVVAQAEARSRMEKPPDVSQLPAADAEKAIKEIIQADYPDKDLPVVSESIRNAGETSAEDGSDGGDKDLAESPALTYAGTITPGEREALGEIIGWDREVATINSEICVRRQRAINEACRGDQETSAACTKAIDAGTGGGVCVRTPDGLAPTGQLAFGSAWSSLAGRHFLGWFLTVAAVSIGSPFWFDFLKLLVSLRGAGAKPGEKKVGDK